MREDPDPRPFYAPPGQTTEWLRAQVTHEQARRDDPNHDRGSCWCCCTSEPCESAQEVAP